jgi:GNAT superfamily N-acetyltransferase
MEEIRLTFEEAPAEDEMREVRRGLRAYNQPHVDNMDYVNFTVFLRDGGGQVVGGLLGNAYWGWLYVDALWVSEPLRQKGYGRRLMLAAEDAARDRGFHSAYLDTFDFQALPFYQKLGYEIFGRLENFPRGHMRYFLRKTLSPTD